MAATGNEAVTLAQLKMLFEGAEDTGSALDALEEQIVLLQGDLESNNTSLSQLQLDVENNTSSLSTLQSDIENNTSSLTQLQGDIESNTSSLSLLQESVVDNTSSVAQLQSKVDECFTSVSEGKSLIAAAVTDSGIQTAADATFATMAENTGNIVGQFSDELDLIIGADTTPVTDIAARLSTVNGVSGDVNAQLNTLDSTKTAIETAIEAKGVDIPEGTVFSDYASKIGEIQTGGSGDTDGVLLSPDFSKNSSQLGTYIYIVYAGSMLGFRGFIVPIFKGIEIPETELFTNATTTYYYSSDGNTVKVYYMRALRPTVYDVLIYDISSKEVTYSNGIEYKIVSKYVK